MTDPTHKAVTYGLSAVVVLLLLFSAFGMWQFFAKAEEDAKTREQMAQALQTIAQRQESIEYQLQEQKRLVEAIDKLNDKIDRTRSEFAVKIQEASKPLPQPQQDNFFVSRGYFPSYYQQDGGRLFGPEATVRLQTSLVRGEECAEVLKTTEEKVVTQSSLIDSYRVQVKDYSAIDEQRLKQIEILKTDVAIANRNTRKEKAKKWTWTIVGIVLGGVAGHSVK